ncbi:hypothetical protein [Rhizobium sp. CG4]|jgi:hypothetical protein|nr:hypothetical protein [Rhizobium sp. CG4]
MLSSPVSGTDEVKLPGISGLHPVRVSDGVNVTLDIYADKWDKPG